MCGPDRTSQPFHPIGGAGRLPRCSEAHSLDTPQRMDRVRGLRICPLPPPPKTPATRGADLGRTSGVPAYLGCLPSVLCTVHAVTPLPAPHLPLSAFGATPARLGNGRAATGTAVGQGSPAKAYPFFFHRCARAHGPGAGPERTGLVVVGGGGGSEVDRRVHQMPEPLPSPQPSLSQ